MDQQSLKMCAEALVSNIHSLLMGIDENNTNESENDITLFSLMNSEIESLRSMGSARTAETYLSALRSFAHYRGDKDISISKLNGDVVRGYEAWLKRRGVTKNTISFYMRRLRASYNHGVRQNLFPNRKPFALAYTGREETRKRAVTKTVMQQLAKYDASDERQSMARDLFMFSFMTRGMSFIDIAMLRKSNIKDGYIIYNRRKTGQQLEIGLTQDIKDIIDRHPSQNDYLLPIIKRQGDKERNQLRYVQLWVNEQLKAIGKKIDPDLHLTMYCARHTWATIAHDMNVPIAVISRGLGHTSEKTTQIYLRSIDTGVIDRANESVIKAVLG